MTGVDRRARLLLLLLVAPAGSRAQLPAAPTGAGEIRGRLVGAVDGRPVTGGSVTVRRAADTAFAGGALPRADGGFRVDGLVPGRYTVRVRALGYAPRIMRDVAVTAETPLVDLGDVTLGAAVVVLEGQRVVAERDEVALAPDRNSYSTKNMTTASGGTTVDVLRSVPSVEVDGSNKVSLRGSENVVVQINGRTSPLKGEQLGNFLSQLPASAVKAVEVATNPSAKSDPEGTAGIINIVLNQDAELGLSGGFTAATATTRMVNVSGNVGRQSGPLTLFLSASLYRDERGTSGTTDRTNLTVPVPAFVLSTSDGAAAPKSGNATLRSEYKIGARDAISFDAFLNGGRYVGLTGVHYSDLDSAHATIGLFDQFRNFTSTNATQDYTLGFRRPGGPATTTFSSELRYASSRNDAQARLSGVLHQGDVTTSPEIFQPQRDFTSARSPSVTWQTDYVRPYGTTRKLELGMKEIVRHTASDFTADVLDASSQAYVAAPGRATAFDYREQIGAAYGVLSQQWGQVQAQAGLRLENAATQLDLPLASRRFDRRYGSAFPSGILSYNVTDTRQAKLSYSRRISRPSPYQLSPVEYRETPRIVFRGNPTLQAEYTDALELGLQDTRPWGALQLTPYLRHTAHAVKYIQQVDAAGVLLSTYDNVASATTVGADVNVTVRGGPLTLFGGGGAYRYTSDATNLDRALSTRATVWSARMNATWKLTPLVDVQAQTNYRSAYATEGGAQSAFVYMSLGVRRKLWADRGYVALRVVDPFNLMIFGSRTTNAQVIEISERRYGTRGVFLTISRSFGQQLKLRQRQQEPDPQTTASPGGG